MTVIGRINPLILPNATGSLLSEKIATEVAKKNMDLEKATADAALKLISSANSVENKGRIDWYA